MKFLIFLLLAPMVFACVVPTDGMVVRESATFCSAVYYLPNGIIVKGSDIEISCRGTVLKSFTGGNGISIENSNNVTIKGCRVNGYDVGFDVKNATLVLLSDNHLVKNKVGVSFSRVFRSSTLNQDVSLSNAFIVSESEKNALSLTNKFVSEDFCDVNYCNLHRDAVVLASKPKLSRQGMAVWFSTQFGEKSQSRLYSWVFDGLF
jgi:hypothetical protein